MAASPPRMPVPSQAPSDAKLVQAVNEMVFQVKQTVATTTSVATSHQTTQPSTYAVRDPPTTQIPRVAPTEAGASRPRAYGSSHSHISRQDWTCSPEWPVFPSEGTTIRWTRLEAEPKWKAVEPLSLSEIEASARQVVGRASEVAADYYLQCLDGIRSRIQDDFRWCSREVQTVRQSAANFRQPEPVPRLMGQIQCLWDQDAVRQ